MGGSGPPTNTKSDDIRKKRDEVTKQPFARTATHIGVHDDTMDGTTMEGTTERRKRWEW